MKIDIEIAKPEDVTKILDIYKPYIINTAITFEYKVPSVEEFKQRIISTLENYPYFVAKIDDKIVGYAYTSAFKNRAAYKWAVESSVYVDVNHHNIGIGRALYQILENISKKQNILNMNACIAVPDSGSVAFHQYMGYVQVAHFHRCGYKLGKWYDVIWMEKIIGEYKETPEVFIPFSKLDYHLEWQYNILGGR